MFVRRLASDETRVLRDQFLKKPAVPSSRAAGLTAYQQSSSHLNETAKHQRAVTLVRVETAFRRKIRQTAPAANCDRSPRHRNIPFALRAVLGETAWRNEVRRHRDGLCGFPEFTDSDRSHGGGLLDSFNPTFCSQICAILPWHYSGRYWLLRQPEAPSLSSPEKRWHDSERAADGSILH